MRSISKTSSLARLTYWPRHLLAVCRLARHSLLESPTSASATAWLKLRLRKSRQSLAALADQGLVSGSSFLLAALIGRFVGVEALGVYGVLVGILLLASSIQDAAISTTYMTRRPELEPAERPSYASACLIFAACLASLSACIAALYCVYFYAFSSQFPLFVSLAGPAAIFLIPLFIMREHLRRFELASMRSGASLQLDASAFGLQFLLLASLIAVGQTSLSAFLVAMSIGNAFGVAWFLLRRRHELFVAAPLLREVASDILHFSKWVLLGLVLFVAGLQVMPWLVIGWLGASEAGAFAACMMLANLAAPVLSGCINWMMPTAAAAYSADGADAVFESTRRQTAFLAVFVACLVLVVCIFAQELLLLTFGQAYTKFADLLIVLTMAFFVRSLGVGAYIGLWAQRTPELNVLANLLMLVTAVALGMALMPGWGALGAGLAVLCGDIASVSARWMLFIRQSFKARSDLR